MRSLLVRIPLTASKPAFQAGPGPNSTVEAACGAQAHPFADCRTTASVKERWSRLLIAFWRIRHLG